MNKFVYGAAGVGLLFWVVLKAVEWHSGMNRDIYGKEGALDENDMAKRQGIVGNLTDLTDSQKNSGSKTTTTTTAQPTVIICMRDVDAFRTSKPTEKIGNFRKGTRLTIGAKDTTSGMFYVTYKEPNGNIIRALCRPQDVGR